MRILIIEDEKKLIDILQRTLRAEGYIVDGVNSASDGLDYIKTYHYDLVILDLQLPDGTGTGLLKRLREMGHTMPALILTARSDLESKVENFQAGADDYVTKPISPKILISRVNALFRRINKEPEEKVLKIENLSIDPAKFEVTVDGKDVTLAKKEFELLYLLASRPGRVFLRNEILNQVWGNEVIVGDRTIDVHIRKIRQKLGLDCITTVKGVGYKFNL